MSRNLPQVRTLDLAPVVGSWLPLGHGQVPPSLPKGFSKPRYTAAEQQANPDKPMTRVIKDVLRTGRWQIGKDSRGQLQFWTVGRKELIQLANAHKDGVCRGVAMNLTKSHGNLQTMIVPTDELIAPVDEMIVEGNVLWVSAYVTPEQAKYLSNPACKVSPGMWDNWVDGYGNMYATKMLHVAVTDHPVIPGQGPFVTMANSQSKKGNAMDFAALLELINQLLAMVNPNAQLPEDTSEDNIVQYLGVTLAVLGGGSSAADTAGDGTGDGATGMGNGTTPPAMHNAAKPGTTNGDEAPAWAKQFMDGVNNQIKTLSNQVATAVAGKVATAESSFKSKLTQLGHAGKVDAKEIQRLTGLGSRHGWDMALLPPDDAPNKVNMSNPAKRMANPATPKISDKGERPSDEDCRKAALARMGRKPEAAKS